MHIRGAVVGVFTLVSGLFWSFAAVSANGSITEEDGFASRVAAERSSAGLDAYAGAGDLVEVARRHAARMAAQDRLHHNPALSSEVSDWEAVGENVGVGASVDDVHRAFMASATHRHAILSTDFTQVGMGVAFGADGRLWVAQVFRRPAAAGSTAPAPAPAVPRSAAAPKPAPGPSVVATRAAARDTAQAEAAARAESEAVAAAEAARVAAGAAARDEAVAAAVRDQLAADLTAGQIEPSRPRSAVLSAALPRSPADGRDVTLPIGVATSLLLAVVVGLLAEGSGRYPLSDWRRQRNQASMSSSRSPSSTAWTLPVS